VLILYGTAFVEENGEVHFFRDIYGHDATLEKALAAARHLSPAMKRSRLRYTKDFFPCCCSTLTLVRFG